MSYKIFMKGDRQDRKPGPPFAYLISGLALVCVFALLWVLNGNGTLGEFFITLICASPLFAMVVGLVALFYYVFDGITGKNKTR